MKTRYLVLFALNALLLSACSFSFATDIRSDGSGKFTIDMEFEESDLSMMGMTREQLLIASGGDTDSLCGDMSADLGEMPEGAAVEYVETEGGFICRFTSPFADIESLRQVYEGMGIEIYALELDDKGGVAYDVALGSTGEEAGLDLSMGLFDLNWIVTLPGKLGENNADQVEGNNLTWSIDLEGSRRFTASSSARGFNIFLLGTLGFAVLCAVVVVVGAIGFFLYSRSKKSLEPAAPEA